MDTIGNEPTAARRLRRRRALLAVLLAASLATLGAGAMSLAIFTDTTATSGAWSSGTVTLGVSPSTTFNVSNILPGDSGTQTVTVSNTGTGDMRYAVSTATTAVDGKGLDNQLVLTIQAGACAAPGATLFTGPLSSATPIGSSAQGFQAGDRAVAAGASDLLCFSWSFPSASGNGFQNAAATATFTFAAEQTANN